MINKIGNKIIDIKIDSNSYQKTIARFDDILNTKINVYSNRKVKPSKMHYNSKELVNPQNLRFLSGSTPEKIESSLSGTGLEGLGEDFVQAEKRYGVNAWFLAALAAHESGYGTSKIARDKNNLFGFTAYDKSPYKSATSFPTKSAGIKHVAKYISDEYLTSGGDHFSGVSVYSVGNKYATDKKWADKVCLIMNELIKKSSVVNK